MSDTVEIVAETPTIEIAGPATIDIVTATDDIEIVCET